MHVEVVAAGVFKPGAQRQIGVGSAWLHRYGQGSSLGRQQYSVRSFRYDGGQEAGKFLQRPARSEIGTRMSGLPTITAITASIEALASISPGKVSIIGPYGQELLTKRLTPLLESQGFSVIEARGESSMLQRTHDSVIGDQDPELIYDFVINSVHPKADTIFLPGTAWRTLEIVQRLEERLQRRVISVNQATIWSTFKKLGVSNIISGFGSLFDF